MKAARTATQWHDVLANYFVSLPLFVDDAEGFGLDDKPTERKVSELPYHLMSAGRWEGVGRMLCDLKFVEAKVRAGKDYVDALRDEYESALEVFGADSEERQRWQARDSANSFCLYRVAYISAPSEGQRTLHAAP